MNLIHLLKVLLPHSARRDNQVTNGDRAKHLTAQPLWNTVPAPLLGVE